MVSNIEEALGQTCVLQKKILLNCRKNIKVQQGKSKLAELCLQTGCENGDTKLNLKTSSIYNL